jgi:hypothetical protein
LEARIAPQGAKGGYAFLLETEDFSIKLLGEHIQNRPSVFIEMRSHALHPHPEGAAGACEAALTWVRVHLYADQAGAARDTVSFSVAKISRADIHIDWQGAYAPQLGNLSEELCCFIRPGRVKGALYFQGGAATGIQFGRCQVVARHYNKTLETKEKANEAYAELLTARCGETFNPELDVWRLEFELKREGARAFGSMPRLRKRILTKRSRQKCARRNCSIAARCPGSLPAWRSSFSISHAIGCGSWRRVTMPTAPAGPCTPPGTNFAKHLDLSPVCRPSMMRNEHWCVVPDTEAGCVCSYEWKRG